MFNIEHIHMEISSKCTLKCPRCPRTELAPKILNNEISLDKFTNSFNKEILQKIKVLTFEGDFGDPIYASSLTSICKYIRKNSNVQIRITTNGSYKKHNWWRMLGHTLNEHDVVTFSIDGWDQESNQKYRVNSDFDSIILGAKTLRQYSNCIMIWKSIYFKFNENDFYKMESLAKELKFDIFETIQSTKFDNQYLINGIDPLKPVNKVSNKSIFIRESVNISDRDVKLLVSIPKKIHPWAKCLNHEKNMFISVTGNVYPCPWFNSGYVDNPFAKTHGNKFNIFDRSLDEILKDPDWKILTDLFNHDPLEICKLKCVK